MHKLYSIYFCHETAFLFINCVDKINVLWKDIFELYKNKISNVMA